EKKIKSHQIEQIQKNKSDEQTFLKYVLVAMALLMAMFAALSTNAQQSGRIFNNVDANGVILDGYDAVAFFTDNKPVKGDVQFQIKYDEATYYFASQKHLDLFKANPEKYKPQFGAWCAY